MPASRNAWDLLRKQLMGDFPLRRCVWLDPVRNRLVIGYGRVVDDDEGPGLYEDGLPEQMLDNDIRRHEAKLIEVLPWTRRICAARHAALIRLAFYPGLDWMIGPPPGALQAAKEGQWETAADALAVSVWAKSQPERAVGIVRQLRTGKWTT